MQKVYLLKLFQEWGRGRKESTRGGEFKYKIFDEIYLIVTIPMYSHPHNNN
jgi:hypothetical protein